MRQILDWFRKGKHLNIVLTQSHWLEEAIFDSYDKCESGLIYITFDFLGAANNINFENNFVVKLTRWVVP